MTIKWKSTRGESSTLGDYPSIMEWLHELQEYGATQQSFDSKFLDSIESWVKEFGGISPRQAAALRNIEAMFEIRKQKNPDPRFPLRAERERKAEQEYKESVSLNDTDYSILRPVTDDSIPF